MMDMENRLKQLILNVVSEPLQKIMLQEEILQKYA